MMAVGTTLTVLPYDGANGMTSTRFDLASLGVSGAYPARGTVARRFTQQAGAQCGPSPWCGQSAESAFLFDVRTCAGQTRPVLLVKH